MKKTPWHIVTLILAGALSWSLTMVKSGLPTKWGIGFWGANGHDGIWHLALIESIKKGFPIQNPLAAGTHITNYHWGFDFILAVISKITHIPSSFLYFQIFPPLLAILIGLFTYLLVKQWTKSNKAAAWAILFTYFGGSFGWIVTLIRSREIAGESLFWSQQAVSTLINPPYALSLVFLLLGFWLVNKNPSPKPKSLVLQLLVFSPLFIIKSYSALIALVGLSVLGLYQWLTKKDIVGLVRLALVGMATLVVAMITSPNAGGLIQFEPLWFTHSMIEASDRLYLPKLILARQAYSAYHMYHRLIPLEILLVALFLLGNLGSRIIALFLIKDLPKQIKNASGFAWALAAMTLAAFILPLLFTQKGTTWNTIQFFYYGQAFLGLMAAIWLAKLNLSRISTLTISLIVIVLTIPTSISTLLQNYIPPRPPATLPYEELSALEFLKKQPKGIVLTYPYVKPTSPVNPPIPLYQYDTTAYVSAFSGQPSYLADTVNLSILNYSWQERLHDATQFFTAVSSRTRTDFLAQNNVAYIYLLSGQSLPDTPSTLGLRLIFGNSRAQIYETKR